ncbi:MAG: hypothetical protein SGI88_03755 [Candidatus Hydrogenedentes bacterium]|nr:hypothetical protein [Candidatus Hydrogenedentota bacterium]
MWNLALLADQFETVLREAEATHRLDQAVYGLDMGNERTIQSILAEGLGAHYLVTREVPYPSSAGRKLSQRFRCDLVIASRSIADEPLWLEIKIAWQFREGGLRSRTYGGQWRLRVAEDVRKIEADPLVRHAGVAMIVFTQSLEIVKKDLDLFEAAMAAKDVIVGFRHVRHIPIQDRIGHQFCTIALWPTLPVATGQMPP